MTETRTIFLALDGRYVTLGRGDDHELTQEQISQQTDAAEGGNPAREWPLPA